MKQTPSSAVANGSSNRRHQTMDMNMYATRKTIAQGIMDLGLMCANASQLKYVLLNSPQHRYFQVTISLIVVSILLQVVVGIIFIVLGRLNINFTQDRRKADMMNNASVILIFLVTVVNVLITAFGPSESFAHLYNTHGSPTSPGKLISLPNFYHGPADPVPNLGQ